MDQERISYDEFKKMSIRIGTIRSAEKIENADKLLRLEVEFKDGEIRQIVSGIAAYFPDPNELVGKQSPFVYNLEPRVIRGYESNGMILGIGGEVGFVGLAPTKEVLPGSDVG